MLKNYILVGLRNLRRNKLSSTVNLISLALGITATILVLQYVGFELSYDKFHENADDIYRITMESFRGEVLESRSANTYYAAAPAIKETFPQVEEVVRLHRADGMVNYYSEKGELKSYFEQSGLYADPSFFSIFSFPLVKGDKNSVLKNANSMLMSESAAKKYFGDSEPIGKVIKLSTEWEGGEYVVEGIFKDIPQNSHLKFDFLFSIKNLLTNKQFRNRGWYWTNFLVYLHLKPGTDVHDLEVQSSGLIEKHLGSELRRTNGSQRFLLQPLTDIHADATALSEININYLLIIAFLIMSIAWLNYLNLATAQAIERAKEVGIRKVLGSEKMQLVKQFLTESFLLCVAAMVLTVILMIVLKPLFTQFIGNDLSVDLLSQLNFWLLAVAVLITGTFLSAFYPAFVLSSFRPVSALKGQGIKSGSGGMKKLMVVLQFAASIGLIIATLTIGKQLDYVRNLDAGLSIKQKLIIRSPRILKSESYLNEIQNFKTLLSQHPFVVNVTASTEVPGKEISWSNEFRLEEQPDSETNLFKVLSVDEDFIPTYEMKLLAGRNFSDLRPSDFGQTIIINETGSKLLGFATPESAIDHEIHGFPPRKIIGVIEDYQQESYKKSQKATLLMFISWQNDYFTVSLNSRQLRSDVVQVLEAFKKAFPDNAVEYFFLDDFFNQQYKSEERLWTLFSFFSMIAIVIACAGLFGLSSFIIAKRTKEVGIRKILGDTESGIVILLSKDFLKLVLIAFVLAVPLAALFLNKWLEGFAHRISIPLWIYLSSGLAAIIVAFTTISLLAIKAAVANPVKALRSE